MHFYILNSVMAIIWHTGSCLLYTSDAADERSSVDLGGRRIIKKKKKEQMIMRDRHTQHIRRKNTTSIKYNIHRRDKYMNHR